MPDPCLLVAAGGTGGHVFPALAVAIKMRDVGWRVEWVGSPRGIENAQVPANDFSLHILPVAGLRGSGIGRLVRAPFMLLAALWHALHVVRSVRPNVVLGMGGFTAGPSGLAAKLLAKPVVVHEQNAIPGMTNKLLAKLATKRLEAFDGAFASVGIDGGIAVGNPLRADFLQQSFDYPSMDTLNVLIVGGSLGAVALNELVPQALAQVEVKQRLVIRHQCGKGRAEDVAKHYSGVHAEVDTVDFIDDMAAAYRWAHIVICRSGAMTVAEVACAGRPAIFIPFPYAVDDHQTANAQWLAERGAALVQQQADLNPAQLANLLGALLNDSSRLQAMAQAAKAAANPLATQRVCDEIAEVVRG